MIRYFYSVCLLLTGTALPLLAKTDATPKTTPVHSSKAGVKTAVLSPAPKAKEQAPKKVAARPAPSTSVADDDGPLPESMPESQRPVGNGPILGNRLVAYPAPKTAVPTSIVSDRSEESGRTTHGGRLARVTAYWAGEGDYYTGRGISSTGVRLHEGHCAVDPNIIPYGSIVEIQGVGKYLAVDTGTAVIARTAAKEGGHTSAQRNALVVDVYFEDRRAGEKFAACESKFVTISWWTPRSADTQARARGLFAAEDWTRIQNKQL